MRNPTYSPVRYGDTTAFGETPQLFLAGDGSRVVVARLSSVVVLDAETGAPTTFDFSTGAGTFIGFAPARDEVYFRQLVDGDRRLRSLNIRTGETHSLLPLTTSAQPEGVAVSPDGRRGAILIREGDQYRLVLMDMSIRAPIYTFAPGSFSHDGFSSPSWTPLSLTADPVRAVFYLHRGDTIEEPMLLYRLQPCAFLRLHFLTAPSIASTSDGRALYAGPSTREAVCIEGIHTATPTMHRVFTYLPDSQSRLPHLQVAADRLLVGDATRLAAFDRATATLQRFVNAPPGLTYASSVNPFVVGRAGGFRANTARQAALFDWQTNQTLWSESNGGSLGQFDDVAFSPRLRYALLIGSTNRVYDLTTRQVARDFPNYTFDLLQPFSSGEEYLISGRDILSIATGQLARRMPGAVLTVHDDIAFCSEVIGGARSITLRRVSTGALVARLLPAVFGSSEPILSLSEDGRRIFVAYSSLVMTYRNPLLIPEGDVNDDGCVDSADLLEVLFAFGSSDASLADLNIDGLVDDADLLMVLFNFGNGC